MIIIKNRQMLFSNREQYLGTDYDAESEIRQFRIDRITQSGVDLAGLTFRMDTHPANRAIGSTSILEEEEENGDVSLLSKEISDEYIILTWTVPKKVLSVPGALIAGIRAIDGEAYVRWSSYNGVFYVERHLNTPGDYGGDLTELQKIEQDNMYMLGVVDELRENLDYRQAAEAYAVGTRYGEPVEEDDPAYHNNAKYYAEQESESSEASRRNAKISEAYAKGTMDGTEVGEEDPGYHDNAQYYKDQAEEAAETAKEYAENIADPVSGIVADWINENLSQETGYVIDNSLTTANAAAGAKKVGDELTDVKNDLTVTRNGIQAFTSSEIIQGSYDATGALVNNPARIRVSGFVQVFAGDKIKFIAGSNAVQMLYGVFDSAKTFVRDSAWLNDGALVDVDSDGFFIIVFRNGTDTNITPEEYDAKTALYTNSVLENPIYNEPFSADAGLLASVVNPQMAVKLKGAIKDVKIYGGIPGKHYYLSFLNRVAENNICTIVISDEDGTEVCSFSKWDHYFPAGVKTEVLNPVNNSGVSAVVSVDWSVWTAGSGINVVLSNSGQTMLSGLCNVYADPEVIILLPPTVYWASGRELSLYFENIILCDNLANYQIDCVCSVGKQQNERFVLETPAVGTYPLTINIYTRNRKRLVASASTTISVVSSSGTGATKNVLLLGDSWTAQTWYPRYLQSRYEDDADTDALTLIGTIYPWGEYSGAPVIEGRSGWSSLDYTTRSSYLGVSNAFWNPSTSAFDFSYYLSHNSLTAPDTVIILLGVNDAATISINSSLTAFNTIINSIHAYDANIKVGLCLVPPPCQSQDGFGKVNGCGWSYAQQKTNAFDLSVALYNAFKNTSNIYFIGVMGAVDMLHNVSRETVPANAYTEVEITRLTDNVHCDKAGFQQVADAVYGMLKNT